MAQWVELCRVEDVEEGEPLACEVSAAQIGVYQVGEEYYALDNICSHAYAILTDGFQENDTIECPLHQALFNIRTGEHLSPPAECGLRTFPTRLDNGVIFADLAAITARQA